MVIPGRPRRIGGLARLAAVTMLTAGVAMIGAWSPAVADRLPTPVVDPAMANQATVAAGANPVMADACGLDLTIALDASGSMETSGAAPLMREATLAMLASLQETGSTARVTQFATLAGDLAPRTAIDAASVTPGGPLAAAAGGYLNPRTGRPPDVDIYRYAGHGSIVDAASFAAATSTEFTNWDAAFELAVEPSADLLIMITDGLEPTAYDLDQPGDPFDRGPPADVAINTLAGEAGVQSMLRAVEAANRVKTRTRILVVGVGDFSANGTALAQLQDLAGPQVRIDPQPSAVPRINDVDVAIVPDFRQLKPFLTGLARNLCGSTVLVNAMSDSRAEPGRYRPAGGPAVTVTPESSGGISWVLPDAGSGPSRTVVADGRGTSTFQWRPGPASISNLSIMASFRQGFSAGRPGEPDYSCEIRDGESDVEHVEGEFVDPTDPGFALDMPRQGIVNCSVFSTFDPRPGVALTQAISPAEVRGDLDPPVHVLSSFAITNPGTVTLSDVRLESAGCADGIRPTSPARLEPGGTLQYTCRREIRADRSPAGGASPVVFDAVVTAIDPFGTPVRATAPAALTAYTPRLGVDAGVVGPSAAAAAGTPVTVEFALGNRGDSALGDATAVATPAACVLRPVDPAGDLLAPGQNRRYRCTFTPDSPTRVEVTARAEPRTPAGGRLADPNPAVTATGAVTVDVRGGRMPASAGSAAVQTIPAPVPAAISGPGGAAAPPPGSFAAAPTAASATPAVLPGRSAATPDRDTTGPAPVTAPGTASPASTSAPASSPPTPPLPPSGPTDSAASGEQLPPDPASPFHLDVLMDLTVGDIPAGRTVQARASRLRPDSSLTAIVYSEPQTLFAGPVDRRGVFEAAARLPDGLEPGIHTVIVAATRDSGQGVTVAGGFRIDDDGRVAAIAQPRPLLDAQPGDPRVTRALRYGMPAYDARTDPATTAGVVTAAALAVGLAGEAGRSRRRGSVKGVIATRIKNLETVDPGPGDRSRSWRWPLTDRTDDFGRWLPTLWDTRTVLIARLGLDGSWARAVFGSLGYLLWVAGAILAIVMGLVNDGRVSVQPVPILLALIAIGVLDASAGAVAFLVLCLIGLATANIGSFDDVRTLLGLGSLLTWPALLTNSIRPLRRPGWPATDRGRLERALDYAIPPVIVAFLAGGVAVALNGLSGLELVTAAEATAVRWVVAIAVLARYGLEDIAATLYPQRTDRLSPAAVGWPTRPATLTGSVVRFVIFVFVAEPYFGLTVSTVLAAVLTVLPGVIKVWEDDLPASGTVAKWLPRGLFKLLVIVVVSAVMARVFIGDGGDAAVRSTMVLMVIPGMAFALLELFGRNAPDWPDTAYRRLGGVLTWVALAGLTTGILALY